MNKLNINQLEKDLKDIIYAPDIQFLSRGDADKFYTRIYNFLRDYGLINEELSGGGKHG